jgi:hypothetical protein
MTVQEAIKDIRRQLMEIEYDDADVTISTESLCIAIECMEKQIPKKPKYKTTCEKCGTHNSVWGRLGNPKGHPIVYCWNCGQANEIDCEVGAEDES